MEELLGGLFRGILQMFGYVIGQLLCVFLFQFTGAIFVRIFTLGKYPRQMDRDFGESLEGSFSMLLGGLIWFCIGLYLVLNFG